MNSSTFAVLALLAVTGCAASADEGASSSENDTTPAPTVSPLVTQQKTTAKGTVLATSAGLSLYTFDTDTTSSSTCYNGCATAWPALLVGATDIVSAPFGTTARTDGTKQLTLNNHPLYRFASDAAAGDVKGDGLGNVWHLAKPGFHTLTQAVVASTGEVLANKEAMSLYTFDPDTTSTSTCYGTCATNWPAALVTADDVVEAPFATTARNDGTLQLTQNGHPLYTFAGDTKPAQINGDGVGGVWHLAKP